MPLRVELSIPTVTRARMTGRIARRTTAPEPVITARAMMAKPSRMLTFSRAGQATHQTMPKEAELRERWKIKERSRPVLKPRLYSDTSAF